MRKVTTEIEDEVLPNDQTGEGNEEGDEGNVCGVVLKKGAWTSAEDDILVDYVNKHGEGNWRAIHKQTGLLRCGKSCRLRWNNHLRPDLKKGSMTAEEEKLIIQLHARMGNKWSCMVAHFPGRTDNEIKNFWNSRKKKYERAGLPLYPPEVRLRASQESQHDQSTSGLNSGNEVHPYFLQNKSYAIHDAVFDSLKDNPGILPCLPGFPDTSAYGITLKELDSPQHCSFVPSTSSYHNHLQESTMPSPDSNVMNRNEFYPFVHSQDNTHDKIALSFGMQSALDPGPSSHNSTCYSHPLSNDNSSTSKPSSEALKLELPSFQYPDTDVGSWGTSPASPLLERVDDFIQSPTRISTLGSYCRSPQNSGLLDTFLYETKTLRSSKNHYYEMSSNLSTATPGDKANYMYGTEWEDYTDSVSPSGASSTLNECSAANSLDERLPVQTLNGNTAKLEYADQVWTPDSENQTVSLLTRPDLLLASDWHEQSSGRQAITTTATSALHGDSSAIDYKHMRDSENQAVSLLTLPDLLLGSDWHGQGSGHQAMTTNATSTLHGDDSAIDYNRMTAGTSKSSQVREHCSCAWCNMPPPGQ